MSEVYDFAVQSIDKVTDGDTYHLTVVIREARSAFRVVLGADLATPEIRLDGWDTPESKSSATRKINDFERAKAKEATEFAFQWMTDHLSTLRVVTNHDPEKYGRWLGVIYDSLTGITLGAALGDAKLATRYDGTNKTKRWFEVYDNA